MKLALQLYSIREDMQNDFFGTLKKVKEIGYDGCEFAGLYGNDPQKINEACKELDLIPISAHVAYQDIIPDIKKAVATYKTIGCKYMVIPYLPEDLRYGTEKYPTLVEDMKKIGKECKENGITLLYHNHDFEFKKAENGEYVLDELYREISADLLATEIDTCWELMRLKDITSTLGLPIIMKIGGVESVTDVYNCLQIGVASIVAPMVETPYALRKYAHMIEHMIAPD